MQFDVAAPVLAEGIHCTKTGEISGGSYAVEPPIAALDWSRHRFGRGKLRKSERFDPEIRALCHPVRGRQFRDDGQPSNLQKARTADERSASGVHIPRVKLPSTCVRPK